MTRLPLILAFAATPALADSERVWPGSIAGGPSIVSIHAPTVEGAVATVTFQNTMVHSLSETFTIDWGGIAVVVNFQWNIDGRSEERITVDAPDGYVAVPRFIDVSEDTSGEIQILKWSGM